jgi:hypothetical protein
VGELFMETLQISSTNKTPSVNFNPSSGILELRGKSIPENSKVFYEPIYAWLEEYSRVPKTNTVVEIQLDYFNTSSAKCIADLFKRFNSMHASGLTSITLNWHYNEDDGDMQEAGADFASLMKFPFHLKSFNS